MKFRTLVTSASIFAFCSGLVVVSASAPPSDSIATRVKLVSSHARVAATQESSSSPAPAQASSPSPATPPAAAEEELTGKAACLQCHDYDDVMETTAKYQMPSGETHTPHRYVDPKAPVDPAAKPHNGKGLENTPECANCHTTPHPIPPDSMDEKEKAERLAKLEVEWCYSSCHHQRNFSKCSTCHNE